MKFLTIILFLQCSLWAQARSWDLNDVSYLMPLPANIGQDSLLRIDTSAAGGALLDPELVKKMPRLVMSLSDRGILESLRVVGVRIDPCFPMPTPMDCQRQVRLIWQIIVQGSDKQVQTLDAALHSFYSLTPVEFEKLLKEISLWKEKFQVKTDGLPLQVHPAWQKDKDQSLALIEFQSLLLRFVGKKNLFRVTNMLLRGANDMWAFQTFEIHEGKFQMQPIPRLDGRLAQTFVNTAQPPNRFSGSGILPFPTKGDTLNRIVADSGSAMQASEEEILKEFAAAVKAENPKEFNAENMDCVSCHVAQSAKLWSLNFRKDVNFSQALKTFEFKNPNYNLENLNPQAANTQNLRAFGYFGSDISLSQRVINESSEVADILNQKFQ